MLNELPSIAETYEPEYHVDGAERSLVGGLQPSLQRDVSALHALCHTVNHNNINVVIYFSICWFCQHIVF